MLAISLESLSLSYHPLNSKGYLLTQLSGFFFRKPKPHRNENPLCSSAVMFSQSVLCSAAQTLALTPCKFPFFTPMHPCILYFWLRLDAQISEILVHYFLILNLCFIFCYWDFLSLLGGTDHVSWALNSKIPRVVNSLQPALMDGWSFIVRLPESPLQI